MKKILLALATLALSLPAFCADGDTFIVPSVEGVSIRFRIISEEEKTVETDYYSETKLELIPGTSVGTYKTYHHPCISTSTVGNITIPDEVNGYKVTIISDRSFYYCKSLTSICLPSSVTTIEGYAFLGCTSLCSITVNNSNLKAIRSHAFEGCTALAQININDLLAWFNMSIGGYDMHSVPWYSPTLYVDGKILKELIVPDGITTIGDNKFWNIQGIENVKLPESVSCIGNLSFYSDVKCIYLGDNIRKVERYRESYSDLHGSFKKSTKIYANPGTVTCLTLWNAGYNVYNKTTGNYMYPPYLDKKSSTQTTLSLYIRNYIPEYSYGCKYSSLEFEGNQLDVKGLRPEQSYSFDLMVCLDGVEYNPSEVNFTTLSISPSVKSSQTTASSVQLSGSYIKGDAEVVSQTIQMAGISQEGNEMVVTGLEPGRSYNTTYTIKVKYGTSTYDYTGTTAFTTEDLVMKSLTPKNVKVGEAVVCAETNVSDRETNVGFEWRKTDAPETVPSKQGTAVIYDGVMEGYIKNLQTTSYYNVRPYYQSAAGNIYYGEWIGIDPADYSYFAPSVHTYAYVEMVDGMPVLSGYVMDGSDDIVERGFEFWLSGSGVKLRVKAEAPADVHTVVASGQKMTATLSGLRSNTTYTCRAYAKTNSETFYGEEISFTTPVATGIEEVQDAEFSAQGNNTVYDVQGRLVGDTLEGLPRGIYIMDGRKYWVK